MLIYPSDDSDNERSNVPYKLEPSDQADISFNPNVCGLTMEQSFFISKVKLDLRARDKDLVEIITSLQKQVFFMQNFMKSDMVIKS